MVHLKTFRARRVRFSGEWVRASHGESAAGIYATDCDDVTSVCTTEAYHEHSAGELASKLRIFLAFQDIFHDKGNVL